MHQQDIANGVLEFFVKAVNGFYPLTIFTKNRHGYFALVHKISICYYNTDDNTAYADSEIQVISTKWTA